MTNVLNLSISAGSREVTLDAVREIATPRSTRTWTPIPHGLLFDRVTRALGRRDLQVTQDVHAVSHDGNRYFSLLQVASERDQDYSLVVGLRNSHDKSFPAGLVVGNGVFVCDNLMFSGEIRLARKHTSRIRRDLPRLITEAVGKMHDARHRQDERIDAYKGREISDLEAHDFVIRALDAQAISTRQVKPVLQEWREPRHPEFKPRTAWSLFNAFTEVGKENNLFSRPRSSQILHGLMDLTCSVN